MLYMFDLALCFVKYRLGASDSLGTKTNKTLGCLSPNPRACSPLPQTYTSLNSWLGAWTELFLLNTPTKCPPILSKQLQTISYWCHSNNLRTGPLQQLIGGNTGDTPHAFLRKWKLSLSSKVFVEREISHRQAVESHLVQNESNTKTAQISCLSLFSLQCLCVCVCVRVCICF